MVIEKLQLRLCLCINWNFLSLYGYFSVFLFGFQEKALLAQGSYVLTHELLTYAGSGSSWLAYYEVVIQSLNFSLWMASCNWKLFPKFYFNLTCSLWNRPETVETWNSFNITSGILMLWMHYQWPNAGTQKNKKQKRQVFLNLKRLKCLFKLCRIIKFKILVTQSPLLQELFVALKLVI